MKIQAVLRFKEKRQKHHCEACIVGKHKRSPFNSSDSRADAPLELVHIDVVGPLPIKALNGEKYLLTIIDDHTRLASIIPLSNVSII